MGHEIQTLLIVILTAMVRCQPVADPNAGYCLVGRSLTAFENLKCTPLYLPISLILLKNIVSGMQPIEIKLNKGKLKMMLVASIIFFIIAVWVIVGTSAAKSFNPFFAKVTGLFGVVFFGAAFVFVWKKVNDNKPGLVIDETGVLDNSSGVSAGLIPWSDITDVKFEKVFNQSFLMLIVRNPNAYIEQQQNVIKKKAMQMNFKNYGSPISIPASTLNYNFDELRQILIEKLSAYKSAHI